LLNVRTIEFGRNIAVRTSIDIICPFTYYILEGRNMQEIYKRKLSYWEANSHLIPIDKGHRDMFPPAGETFTVVIDEEKFEATINSFNRIWLEELWKRLPHFREGDTIVFSKNPDGSFNVTIEE